MKNQENLRKLQLIQLEILKEVDRLCNKNNIKYSLYGGTLLGAIRHKGFIPWDDDLDICMTRDDFNKFVNIWESEEYTQYYLQNIDKEESFTQTFTKIRKNNTAFVQAGEENSSYHTGIFIDIFILDRVPFGKIKRLLQRIYGSLYLLYTRKYAQNSSGKLIKVGCEVLLGVVPKNNYKKIRNFSFNKIKRYNNHQEYEYVDYSTFETLKTYLPSVLFKDTTLVEFENYKFQAFSYWDLYLKLTYNDYMKLPPEKNRTWTHSPIYINFEKSYKPIKM